MSVEVLNWREYNTYQVRPATGTRPYVVSDPFGEDEFEYIIDRLDGELGIRLKIERTGDGGFYGQFEQNNSIIYFLTEDEKVEALTEGLEVRPASSFKGDTIDKLLESIVDRLSGSKAYMYTYEAKAGFTTKYEWVIPRINL